MISHKDAQLLKKLLARDQKTLSDFYFLHKKPLENFVGRFIGADEEIEEVVQDTFFAFFEALRDFFGGSSLKTYLYAIGRRKAIDVIRKKRVKRILFSHLPSGFIESMSSIFLEDELDRYVLAQKIETVLQSLPNDYMRVLRLKYWEDLPVADIAQTLRMSFKAAESLLFRARKAFIIEYSRV